MKVDRADEPKIGARRDLSDADGNGFTEELTELDESGMRFAYKFATDSPLPVEEGTYSAEVTLEPSTEGTLVHWVGYFEPRGSSQEEVQNLFHSVYIAFIDKAAEIANQ